MVHNSGDWGEMSLAGMRWLSFDLIGLIYQMVDRKPSTDYSHLFSRYKSDVCVCGVIFNAETSARLLEAGRHVTLTSSHFA
jgi:hypothetical protein